MADTGVTNSEKKTKIPRWALIVVPVALVIGVVVGIIAGRATAPTPDPDAALDGSIDWEEGDRIGYATNVVTGDPETLQAAVDAMLQKSESGGMTLEYKNILVSDDGVNFTCYIANAAENTYDLFITIYADQQLTDQIYVSELLRPGSRFEKIALNKQMEPGTYSAYMVQTQVYDDESNSLTQTIHTQVAVTVELVVY